ncbi:MAG: PleD family two-component system response regulator [Scytolyngbya sp. HA4215-MV1]|nr:PleD family two-component system response regulator [Scytolyngbya sp. HA4215-MV1]
MILASEQSLPLVLVVDDDSTMRILLRRAMEKQGYRVAEASNGQECLEIYTRLRPDIVLLDAMMPIMDGFECCLQLQKLPEANRTPVLIITGLEDKASVDRAFEVGAADYVTKPIHWPVLCHRVRRLINQLRLYQQLEAANLELQRLAGSDGLTHLANRRYFDKYLYREWQRMSREQGPISLILCDVDHFKIYNDTYGHQAGDKCLQQVAEAISRAAKRSTDLVARYGGEEFVVVLPNTPSRGAVRVAEEIQMHVKNLALPHLASPISQVVTLSLGIATQSPASEVSESALIKAADEALYQAKHEGRDRYCLHAATCLDEPH